MTHCGTIFLAGLVISLLAIPGASANPLAIDQPGDSLLASQPDFPLPPPNSVSWDKIILPQLAPCWTPLQKKPDSSEVAPVPLVNEIMQDEKGNVLSIAPKKVEPDIMPPVLMFALLDRQGNVQQVQLQPESVTNADQSPGFRKVATDAMQGVLKCSPIRGLPAREYERWKKLPLKFETQPMPAIY